MKIIVILIPINLVTNWLLLLLRPFGKFVISQQKVFLFFVYSESHSCSEASPIQKTFIKEFSYMLFLFVYSSMIFLSVDFSKIKLEVLHSTFWKWSRD